MDTREALKQEWGEKTDGQEYSQFLEDRLESAMKDNRRWQYVRSLAQPTQVNGDGRRWKFAPIYYGRGETVEEAIDRELDFLEGATRKRK